MSLALPPRPFEQPALLVHGPLAVATRSWRIAPPRRDLVIIAKTTCTLPMVGAATPLAAASQPPLCGELPHDEEEGSSPRYSSDFAPFKPQADVMLVGHARPPRPSPVAHVQLRVGDVLHRRIAAIGPRVFDGDRPSPPAPFEALPLRPELAFGGPEHPTNGLGKGHGSLAGVLPCLEDPDRLISQRGDVTVPMHTGPEPLAWSLTAERAGTFDEAWLRERWPHHPHDFDWSVYNAAPPAQRIAFPRGDEAVEIAGCTGTTPVVRSRLPGIRARAFAVGAARREIPMQLDTVWIDTDAMQLVLVWRGHCPIADSRATAIDRIFVVADSLAAPLDEAGIDGVFLSAAVATHGPQVLVADAVPASSEGETFAPRPAPVLEDEGLATRLVGDLVGVDLSGCDLRGRDLRGRDLTGARLIGARLDDAQLDGATLTDAVLHGASAPRASFVGADLSGANLMEATLTGADLTRAKLHQASLARVKGEGMVLSHAELDHVDLSEAWLIRLDGEGMRGESVDLSGANLSECRLAGAQLDRAFLLRARASGAVLTGATLAGACAEDAELVGAKLDDLNGDDASFAGADLTGASLRRASLAQAVFDRAQMMRADLTAVTARRARFRHAGLERARLSGADLMQATFEQANLGYANLRSSNLYGAELLEAQLAGADWEDADVVGTKLEA